MSRREKRGIPLAAAIKQVAYYDDVSTPSQAITAVDTANTIIIPSISFNAAGNASALVYMQLASSTSITITGGAAAANVWVVEFLPGVIKSIQRFVKSTTTDTTSTQAITAVDTNRSIIMPMGSNGTSGLSVANAVPRHEFNSSTEVGMFYGTLSGETLNSSFQVIEFYNG